MTLREQLRAAIEAAPDPDAAARSVLEVVAAFADECRLREPGDWGAGYEAAIDVLNDYFRVGAMEPDGIQLAPDARLRAAGRET